MLLEAVAGVNDRVNLMPIGKSGQAACLLNLREDILTVQLLQRRFVIEQIHLGRATGLEKIDDPLGLGWVMRNSLGTFLFCQQVTQRH